MLKKAEFLGMMSKNRIELSRFLYKGTEFIKIKFSYDKVLLEAVKKLPQRRYEPDQKYWYVPYSKENVDHIINEFSKIAVIVSEGLKLPPEVLTELSKNLPRVGPKLENKVSDETTALIARLRQYMEQKRYSDKSIATYLNMLKVFFNFYADKKCSEITESDIIQFNHEYILGKGYSVSYQRQMINAIKLFYRQVEKKNLDPEQLIRPKKAKTLPVVLSMEEVKDILNNLNNTKHKVIVSTLYSAGLRIGECLALKITDIDFDRMAIHVRSGKGRKDRYIPLSENLKMMLKVYLKQYAPRVYLFEGQGGGEYSSASVNALIGRAVRASGIEKRVTAHTFRHSFATHLLESGTDLRFIQDLLGHASSRTTEIYTHVSRRSLAQIKSPFDSFQFS